MPRIFDIGGREVERSQTIEVGNGKPAKGANPHALGPILPVSRGSAARDSSPSASSGYRPKVQNDVDCARAALALLPDAAPTAQ